MCITTILELLTLWILSLFIESEAGVSCGGGLAE